MKTTQLFTIGALVATAAAQTLDSLPACGKLCVNNMLEKASELGCASGDVACLCKNVDFAYGIRDCSTAVCGAEAAAPVIAYGEKYCGSAGTSPDNSPSATATTTISANPSGKTGPAVVATITSGTQVYTSTLGFTTLTSTEATPSSVSSLTSSIGSSASSALASLSSQLSSVSSQASSASESATSTSSSSGARRTAIAGLAAAAGLAGLVL